MKYYINKKTQQIYAYEDWVDNSAMDSGLTPIAEAEALAIANPPPTPQQLQQWAEMEKRALMSRASGKIAPLQYAVDLQMETDNERVALTGWKKYMVLLNRVDCSTAPNIDWPKAPE
ncbi:tail fiber assembly protein [Xenorhabdus thuongxuanensis]|uniref:Tail fiber assembly protein n=1 Tax=Xenorhabdus thuongxuanensis TaxID=1873484 RepID=A0A1Q5TJA7_9GAMM|nr:tail fiber assembly protein [Xenorhabdus thuongxuanensis]OKP00305.1 tail fiber assembly protein [Xenorhabdus thuongxuanensis]OKP01150.1 tail fiber assembly protein [Xenorhabdus thuongxuanensis]